MTLVCVRRGDLNLRNSLATAEKFSQQFQKIKDQDLDIGDLTVERALGIH